MKADRTPLVLALVLAAVLLLGPIVPRWALFLLTIALAKGLVVLGLLLFLRCGLALPRP